MGRKSQFKKKTQPVPHTPVSKPKTIPNTNLGQTLKEGVTLGVGIVTTLFSAYFIARHLTSMVVLKDREGKYFNL